jgi:hypothetical protein
MNTQLCIDILTWFVTKSGHKGYENTTIPEKCPQPVFVEDRKKIKTQIIHLMET